MKIALVSSLIPATHYSRYLAQSLQKYLSSEEFVVLSDKNKRNLKIPLKNVVLSWHKNIFYILFIVRDTLRYKIDVVHLQHEINMFGGVITAFFFPVLPLIIRIFKKKVVITIHAAVDPTLINEDFIKVFMPSFSKIPAGFFKLLFTYLYKTISLFSNSIVVHSKVLKDVLVNSYNVPQKKIVVIPIGVPKISEESEREEVSKLIARRFILYFGYLHKRKNLEVLLGGFKKLSKKYSDIVLVLAGGTLQKEYEEIIEKLIMDLDIEDSVVRLGFVSKRELNWLMVNSLFVVQPALYSVAASGPLAEIIAHHKAVVASKVGVMASEVEDRREGILVENTIDDWYRGMNLLTSDISLKEKCEENMKVKHQMRTWDKSARANIEVYKKLFSS